MKNILVFVLFIVIYSTAYTQTEKGSVIISLQGNNHFDFNSTGFESPVRIVISGQWLPMDNLAIGVSHLSTFPGVAYPTRQTGPFIRKYFGKYDLEPYMEVGIGLYGKKYYSHYENELYLKPGAGVIYSLHKNGGIDTSISLDIISQAELHWNFGVFVNF